MKKSSRPGQRAQLALKAARTKIQVDLVEKLLLGDPSHEGSVNPFSTEWFLEALRRGGPLETIRFENEPFAQALIDALEETRTQEDGFTDAVMSRMRTPGFLKPLETVATQCVNTPGLPWPSKRIAELIAVCGAGQPGVSESMVFSFMTHEIARIQAAEFFGDMELLARRLAPMIDEQRAQEIEKPRLTELIINANEQALVALLPSSAMRQILKHVIFRSLMHFRDKANSCDLPLVTTTPEILAFLSLMSSLSERHGTSLGMGTLIKGHQALARDLRDSVVPRCDWLTKSMKPDDPQRKSLASIAMAMSLDPGLHIFDLNIGLKKRDPLMRNQREASLFRDMIGNTTPDLRTRRKYIAVLRELGDTHGISLLRRHAGWDVPDEPLVH